MRHPEMMRRMKRMPTAPVPRSPPDPEGFDVGSAKDLDMGSVNAMHQ